MGLDHTLVGVPSEPQLRSWDSKDALLYAVGVGAGLGDPLQELEFTTENCQGIEQQVLPILQQLVTQRGANMVLDKQVVVLANNSSYDITADIIARLNAKMPGYKVTLPAPPPQK